jgi:hypothetical protein
MKVVDPNNTSHEVVIIPRTYEFVEIQLELSDVSTPLTSYVIINGFLFFYFDYTFTEGQRFKIKINNGTDVIYRGNLIATSQNPQEFKASKDLYYYE